MEISDITGKGDGDGESSEGFTPCAFRLQTPGPGHSISQVLGKSSKRLAAEFCIHDSRSHAFSIHIKSARNETCSGLIRGKETLCELSYAT